MVVMTGEINNPKIQNLQLSLHIFFWTKKIEKKKRKTGELYFEFRFFSLYFPSILDPKWNFIFKAKSLIVYIHAT